MEVVRRCFEALERAIDAYWRDPRSIVEAMEADDLWPEWQELFDCLDPQVEWQTRFLGESFRGHLAAARVWDDFLKWAQDYRPSPERITDLGNDHVLATVAVSARGRDSTAQINAPFFSLMTVQDGLIVRLEEYLDRAEALEAAGADET